MLTRHLVLGAAVVSLAGCSRPAKVRLVASQSLPIVQELNVAGAGVNRLLAGQRRAIDANLDDLDADRSKSLQRVAEAEARWARQSDGSKLATLNSIRSQDAVLTENPMGIQQSRQPRASKLEPIDLQALDAALTALERLKTAGRTGDIGDLATFAQDVCEARTKLAKEQKLKVKLACETPAPTEKGK